MHVEPARRLAHVVVVLLNDAQDLLPAHAFGPERRPGYRRQHRPAIEQGVYQPRLVQRLRPMSSAPARGAKIAVAKLPTSVTTTIRMRA